MANSARSMLEGVEPGEVQNLGEFVEGIKTERMEPCVQANASKKDAVAKLVRNQLKEEYPDITDNEIQITIQASFSFPVSGRVARARDAHGSKQWLRIKD